MAGQYQIKKEWFRETEGELKETIQMLDSKLLDAIQRYELYQDRLTMLRSKIPASVLKEMLLDSPWIADWFNEDGIAL
jgi:ribosomal protein S25